MSYEDHAAGVAEDYRDALDGLTMNSRVEISNLTLIARENTEFANAIAEALQDHIKKVAPPRKLPALYLLDSIVKNVGTPYTLFFGRKLYSTFMEAYAAVDQNTRRKMDEMLKTWKEPVPGSIDTRPVFPPDVVRPIENALIKVRTSTLQANQEHMRKEQQLLSRGRPQAPYRETPTPPGGGRPTPPQNVPYGQPPYPGANGAQYPDPATQTYPIHPAQQYARSTPQPPPSAPAAMPFQPPAPAYGAPPAQPGGLSMGSLSQDVEQLITACKAEFAQNVHDASIQTRLKALLDLQSLLQAQHLPPDQLMLIKTRVDELSVEMRGRKAPSYTPTPPVTVPPYQPPPHQPPAAAPVPPPATAPPPAAGVSLDALLGRGALASLLARQSATPSATPQAAAPYTPPPPAAAAVAAIRSPVPQVAEPPKAAAAPVPDPMALMGILRKAGMLSGLPGAAPPPAAPPMHAPTPVSLPPGLASVIAAARSGAAVPREPLEEIRNDIVLTADSLKKFRPHLIPLMYDDLGPPCAQCGRRFRTDEEGRAKKTAHMDWHFRIHQRIVEAEKRGQHRSWYVDQMDALQDWIRSREAIDVDHVEDPADGKGADGGAGGAGGGSAGGAGGKQAAKVAWIPVPAGAGSTGVCPICQEQFKPIWLDEAQEWVWMDAVRVGGRVYHASCHAEATRGAESQPPAAARRGGAGGGGASGARRTPDRGFGGGRKRKAEDDHARRGKVKGEPKVDLNALPY
ncbi:uncharacterized protein E0L32_008057 [Thyridium curvatum]|uniref:CID domain-containing protein n=1 Tax=Thyridium curvatum TaxID=1093900 RepID=A0A507B361_9PEZI|nr:uncharacterized protein E0L32_008057 [Thyridium curvatum]TPX11020.1 hypothetical protein E0L32_008057 [Thyridium curvatum]